MASVVGEPKRIVLGPGARRQTSLSECVTQSSLTRARLNLANCTNHCGFDGYFLMRPFTPDPNNPLTLVLWCKDRVYNVLVRRRLDNRYALGSAKPDEQSFASIDEIIPFYRREKLNLYTGGVQTGSTTLSETPPK